MSLVLLVINIVKTIVPAKISFKDPPGFEQALLWSSCDSRVARLELMVVFYCGDVSVIGMNRCGLVNMVAEFSLVMTLLIWTE